ncbi:hypothetical protein [Muricomes intestini]|uniref:hypothetical protein n=1 Tax=Muricomes intestini TaxID=1796634 RepID=UPI002FE009E4
MKRQLLICLLALGMIPALLLIPRPFLRLGFKGCAVGSGRGLLVGQRQRLPGGVSFC